MAVEDVLARARLLVDLHRYDEADPLLAQALAQEPDNEDGLALFSRMTRRCAPHGGRRSSARPRPRCSCSLACARGKPAT